MDDATNLLDGLDIWIPEAPQSAARPGTTQGPTAFFGPYQLIQQVGVGGVARVMRARHIHPHYAETTFAVKVLHDELSRDPQVVSLFRNEAYVLSMLKHPNVVQTFEAGEQDGRLFIAMEYIDGRDLDDMMTRCQRAQIAIPMPISLHIVGEILKGLAYAHDLRDADHNPLKLVHRDVNPANVFLSYDGRVKLGDFGVAVIAAGRLEKSREVAGKIGYFSPEQLAGEEVDQAADLFAVGVILFELLCGTRLFEGETTDQVMRLNKRAKIPPPCKVNPAISEAFEPVILCALERKPEDRYPSARAMYEAIRPHLPKPAGMPLAVAALVRKIFVREHIQELQLREGLSGDGPVRGAGQLVALCTDDERAQAAFNELLASRGYRVETHETLDTLGDSLAGGYPPSVILMDVGCRMFGQRKFVAAIGRAHHRIPVIALSDGLDSEWIHRADSIGAVDLLFKPFNIECVLTAVRASLNGAAQIGRNEDTKRLVEERTARMRVLLVTTDPGLAARLTSALSERAIDLEVSPTMTEALERTMHASYNAAIYDAHPVASADRSFLEALRRQPGMGLVPVLYLAGPEMLGLFTGGEADRAAARSRMESPVLLAEALCRLCADTRLGRTFVRYAAHFPIEVRYGGRVFSAETIDVSRGGLMMRCPQMLPVGTAVSVALKLPSSTSPVEANGQVVRVDLPKGEDGDQPRIGIVFDRFVARSESVLISFLSTLDPGPDRRHTVILGGAQAPRAG